MERRTPFQLLFFLVGFFFFVTSCEKKGQIEISGTLTNNVAEYIYISEVRPDGVVLLDSAKIDDGVFTLVVSGDGSDRYAVPSFFQISLSSENALTTIAQAGDALTLTADARRLVQDYTVSGNANALLMRELDVQLAKFIDSTNALMVIYENHIEVDSARSFVEESYNRLVANHAHFLVDFIHKNRASLASVAAFYQRYNRCIFINETENLPLLKEIHDALAAQFPQSENVLWIEERLKLKENETN